MTDEPVDNFDKMVFAHLRRSDRIRIRDMLQTEQSRSEVILALVGYLTMWGGASWVDREKLYLLGVDVRQMCPLEYRDVVAFSVLRTLPAEIAAAFMAGFAGVPAESAPNKAAGDDANHPGERLNSSQVNSPATYTRVDQYGFIEAPYRKVKDGVVSNDVVYLSAIEEGRYTVAHANSELDADGRFVEDLISCRRAGEFVMVSPGEINMIDVSPKQLASVAAALIPFVENDDANGALMSASVQRHAVASDSGDAITIDTPMLCCDVPVAFMPWNGDNFEDSILISERIVHDDVFTSIHIEEFEVMARDTKLGQEEITRDIPNVGEEALKNLDEAGIVYIGAEVKPGDILVGKVTPKGESPMTPEEKLLRAIFGEKASDVRDTSLRLPPGVAGTIVEVRVFSRRGVEKDERALAIERAEIERLAKDRDDERAILERSFYARRKAQLLGKKVVSGPKGIKAGSVLTDANMDELHPSTWHNIAVDDDAVMAYSEALKRAFDQQVEKLQERFENKVEKLQRGDELPPGVMKMVKVFVAVKRKLQPGDKMAGRHGNKGVISRIMPLEDMPYLEDGQQVDVVLNLRGLPNRMNVGQILETHLGWVGAGLGQQIGVLIDRYRQNFPSVGDLGTELEDIYNKLEKAGFGPLGQVTLYDGRTGEPFDRKVTVAYIHMLKLHHLADNKISTRSINPYSLVSRQSLSRKAQFGRARFSEMEIWALEAYGAAYTLQEMLTVKSDDVSGRTKVYEAIVRGDDTVEAGIPESFNVLVKSLRSLGLNVEIKAIRPR